MGEAVTIPRIFSTERRRHRGTRAAWHASYRDDVATFIGDEIGADMVERLAFVRAEPKTALLIGRIGGGLSKSLWGNPVTYGSSLDIEQPFGPQLNNLEKPFEFIGVSGVLDAVNDVPGALIHIRNALGPGGLAIASFVGGASLPRLRAAMLAANPERPAARLHPMIDPRAAPSLLQRAGWKDPVVDTHTLSVRYGSLDRLVRDLREQALGNALADQAPPLGKVELERARAAFLDSADAEGKVTESFEIVTLTGRRSLAGT